jgi:hypothetical protein
MTRGMWGRLSTCGGLGVPFGPRLPLSRGDAPGRLRLAAMWGRFVNPMSLSFALWAGNPACSRLSSGETGSRRHGPIVEETGGVNTVNMRHFSWPNQLNPLLSTKCFLRRRLLRARLESSPRERRLKTGCSQDWMPHNLCGISVLGKLSGIGLSACLFAACLDPGYSRDCPPRFSAEDQWTVS